MDHTQILNTLQNDIPTAIWYLIPLLILSAIIKSSSFKGKAGEAVVNLSARLSLDKTRYHLIKNVTLPTEDGTSQIDHIIVSCYDVFVVEIKFTKGWVFGKPNQRYWTVIRAFEEIGPDAAKEASGAELFSKPVI